MRTSWGLVLCGILSASLLLSLAAAQTPPALTTLYSFTTQVSPKPSSPIGGVIVAENGMLYGTSVYGESVHADAGAVYELIRIIRGTKPNRPTALRCQDPVGRYSIC
jgi:hypothetical protein